jgi:protein-L-isoaspartate O-methyltransferase
MDQAMKQEIEVALSVYRRFKQKPESQRIASEFALIELSKLLSETTPKRVLEIGGGIGTITALLIEHPNRPTQIVTIEDNDVCLEQFKLNIPVNHQGHVRLFRKIEEVDLTSPFDLIIFDGRIDDGFLRRVLREGLLCFIEGSRSFQQRAINEAADMLGLHVSWKRVRPMWFVLKSFNKYSFFGFEFLAPRPWPFKRKKGCWVGSVSC